MAAHWYNPCPIHPVFCTCPGPMLTPTPSASPPPQLHFPPWPFPHCHQSFSHFPLVPSSSTFGDPLPCLKPTGHIGIGFEISMVSQPLPGTITKLLPSVHSKLRWLNILASCKINLTGLQCLDLPNFGNGFGQRTLFTFL